MNYALRLPDYCKIDIDNLKGKVSINQFIVNAVVEKIASLKTLDYIEDRAKKGSSKHAIEILSLAADNEPEKYDRF